MDPKDESSKMEESPNNYQATVPNLQVLTSENFPFFLQAYDLKFEEEEQQEFWTILRRNFGKEISKVFSFFKRKRKVQN